MVAFYFYPFSLLTTDDTRHNNQILIQHKLLINWSDADNQKE
jgi:hypothetical protein